MEPEKKNNYKKPRQKLRWSPKKSYLKTRDRSKTFKVPNRGRAKSRKKYRIRFLVSNWKYRKLKKTRQKLRWSLKKRFINERKRLKRVKARNQDQIKIRKKAGVET